MRHFEQDIFICGYSPFFSAFSAPDLSYSDYLAECSSFNFDALTSSGCFSSFWTAKILSGALLKILNCPSLAAWIALNGLTLSRAESSLSGCFSSFGAAKILWEGFSKIFTCSLAGWIALNGLTLSRAESFYFSF